MALNERWKDSAAVKGRILVTTPTGRRVAFRLGTFASGAITLTYRLRSPGRYRVNYAWLIPASYLAAQPLRPGARSSYRTGKWQTAATFFTRARTCT
jgi:hypothetical protein